MIRAAGLTVLLAGIVGCHGGSLATDSGPAGQWSTDNEQMVHVGEHVAFSFGITKGLLKGKHRDPIGVVDYCIAYAGSETIEADLDGSGHYRFAYDVVGLGPGSVVDVSASAYRMHGDRDVQYIGEMWVRGDSPYDPPDALFATDTVTLTVYKSVIELPVDDTGSDLDLDGARLELHRSDGIISTVLSQARDPRGFSVGETDGLGTRIITYEPSADEINKFGDTYVRLTAFDAAGQQRIFDGKIPTP